MTYICAIDDALDSETCSLLIKTFNSYKEKQQFINRENKPRFTQMDLIELAHIDIDVSSILNEIIEGIRYSFLPMYLKHIGEGPSQLFPKQWNLENFRIKHYSGNNQDKFDTHIDVADYASARRFLAIFFYLNNVDSGGETLFFGEDIKIKPKMGTVVMFPPFWMYPHKGNPTFQEDKFLLSTYLHYRY